MKVFLKGKRANYDAIGEYNYNTNELIVKKGSVVSLDVKEFRGTPSIIKKRSMYVKNRIVFEDIVFKSPSTAANFISGRSKNGLDAWKNENGKNLKEIIKER